MTVYSYFIWFCHFLFLCYRALAEYVLLALQKQRGDMYTEAKQFKSGLASFRGGTGDRDAENNACFTGMPLIKKNFPPAAPCVINKTKQKN